MKYKILIFLYNLLVIPILWIGFLVLGFFNKKVRTGIRGRKALFPKLRAHLESMPQARPRFWIHTSSMGEFEQAKPIIAALKEKYPNGFVIVSFFSPSAFDHVQDYNSADFLCYLPFDSLRLARRFLTIIQPNAVIVIRHDIWPNHLAVAKFMGIPTLLVNASIQHPERFRKPLIRELYRFLFGSFDWVLTVSEESKSLYETYRLGRSRIEVIGDTRYDQVVQRAKEAENIIASLRKLKAGRKCFVVGSSWPSDEEIIFTALAHLHRERNMPWVILVPHEPAQEHVEKIERQLTYNGISFTRLSNLDKIGKEIEVLIVDRIGILASLYALGDLTFVGGGFGPGIHSVLEPAAFGKVILFGPRHTNSYEAGVLKRKGVGIVVQNGEQLYNILYTLLNNPQEILSLGKKSSALVETNRGATERILNTLELIIQSP